MRIGRKMLSSIIVLTMVAGIIPVQATAETATASVEFAYGDNVYARQMERLDRGLVAIKTDDGVYLSWRMAGDEGSVFDIKNAPDFEVYRNGEKIAMVTQSTNYLDCDGGIGDKYSVAIEGEECCEDVAVWNNNYFDIPMDIPDAFVYEGASYPYEVGEASTGDLDGDGQYEIVVKWDANPQDNAKNGVTGNVYLDAYELDGTRLWRIDLGRNIRSGDHYTQFLVYDFDLDGCAEITAKTAPGSVDGKGRYVSEASLVNDIKKVDNNRIYISETGRVIEGDEFFTAFDGGTGKALDTIYYPNQRIRADVWGDELGNRCDRFLACVATLDGEKPYAVYWRGYYKGRAEFGERTGIFGAYLDENKRIQVPYCFDTYNTSTVENYKGVYGYSEDIHKYTGQGNHNITVADVDNDGKDEFISGSLCMEINDENKLMPKWCSFRGHGDALHIGDYDPTQPGFEYFSVHESGGESIEPYTGKVLDFGMTVYDAATGEELVHRKGEKDTQTGTMANIGAGGYYQIFGASNTGSYTAYGNGVFKENGIDRYGKFRLFYDADLYDEMMSETYIYNWNGDDTEVMLDVSEYGCISVKRSPALSADLLGDWREEVLFPLSDYSALRLFITTDVTQYKLPTLMHDPVYRSGVAAQQTAYNQPPHIGFYLSDDLFENSLVGINIIPPYKTVYAVGEKLDTSGMQVVAVYDEMTDGYDYSVTDYTVSGYNPMATGEQEISVAYKEFTQSFTVTVETNFICDENGYITGYKGYGGTETIPEYIDGIKIRGIGANALDNTCIEFLYVYDHIREICENSFSGVIIGANAGSAAYRYALENGLELMLLSESEYEIDIDFSEGEFDGFKQIQGKTVLSASMEGITLVTNPRGNGGDGKTGFAVLYDLNGNKYLKCGAGKWSNAGRHACIKLDDLLDGDYTMLSFDIYFPRTVNDDGDEVAAYISVESGNGVVEKCSVNALEAEFDTWYNYSLICMNGEYIRVLTDIKYNAALIKRLGKVKNLGKASTLQIYADSDYASVGNTGGAIYMDNFRYFSHEPMVHSAYEITDKTIVDTGRDMCLVDVGVIAENTENVSVMAAVFDENGRLVQIKSKPVQRQDGIVDFNMKYAYGQKLRLFEWRGQLPLTEAAE